MAGMSTPETAGLLFLRLFWQKGREKMLSEQKTLIKLEDYAAMFNDAVQRKAWGVAHNLYNMVHTVAVFMEIGDAEMKKLFGDWDSDDGTDTDTAMDGGLFRRSVVEDVNWRCCIKMHQSYEDVACRAGQRPMLEYYSDEDYCARCEERKKRAARR